MTTQDIVSYTQYASIFLRMTHEHTHVSSWWWWGSQNPLKAWCFIMKWIGLDLWPEKHWVIASVGRGGILRLLIPPTVLADLWIALLVPLVGGQGGNVKSASTNFPPPLPLFYKSHIQLLALKGWCPLWEWNLASQLPRDAFKKALLISEPTYCRCCHHPLHANRAHCVSQT